MSNDRSIAIAAVVLGICLGFITGRISCRMLPLPVDKYHEHNNTLGEMFHEIAADEDAIADEWEWRLAGNGRSGWAGWDCGRSDSGCYRGYAMAMIKTHRDAAHAIREERVHSWSWGDGEQRQKDWQAWYDDFHKRHPEAPRPEIELEKKL